MVLACRFYPREVGGTDASGSLDGPAAPDGHGADAPSAGNQDAPAMLLMNGSACGGAVWHADFSVDPTTIDLNGDGIDDFAVRGSDVLPGTLGGGMWTVPAGSLPLDTQPKQPFTTRVVLDVTMQSTSHPSSGHGTVAWINTAYGATTFAPLFLDLQRDSNSSQSQSLTVYGKMGGSAAETKLDGLSFGDDAFHHFHVDIDPSALSYHLVIDGTTDRGALPYYAIALGGNTDQWATVVAYGGDSVFDDFQIEVCP
jgi:hypothetical protein